MIKSICIGFSRLAGLLLSASLLGACAMPTEPGDEFEASDEMELEDMGEEVAEAEQEIVGGGYASGPYQFPYQVQILKNGGHWCGGAILRSRWILTAAHCVYGQSAGQLTVRAGEYNLGGGDGTEQTRTVASLIPHPNFNSGTLQNDIALIELSSGLSQNAAVQTIALPTGPAPLNTNAVVSGWGNTSAGSGTPQFLKYALLPTVANSTCAAVLGSLDSNELCAGFINGASGGCHGDSGGPLALNGQLIGVVSWGSASCNSYTIFAEVFDHNAWIKGITGL